ncbi:unnamed protein product [Rotaria socialis]|uniref:Reverse transcriptase domain-containing protein n=1 Tax=Rotaria socialis TaxID=392032 RepID=A0A821LFE4_9BILA|nr:unnamed protein product [Rotaria socialis]
MLEEWNCRVSLSSISKKWHKDRPVATNENLSLILYNCQCLSTHIADIDILLSTHIPQLLILTGVGSKIRNLPKIASYYWISQEGTNSFGGVAILLHDTLKTKVITREFDFLLIELDILPKPILLGAVYVPPGKPIPQFLFDKYVSKSFYIFGDFNAKHTDWLCNNNNASGVQLKNWLENTGCEMIYPNQPTSKRSSAVIDFGITHNANGWKADVIREGSSDHYPVLIQSPLTTGTNIVFRKTNWKVFAFFLKCVFPYFNSIVYNLDADSFFDLFSAFLSSTWDRVSEYLPVKKYRPPWPPYLVQLARNLNKTRQKYRRYKNQKNLEEYLQSKNIYFNEKSLFIQNKMEKRMSHISHGNNIWKYVHPTFHPYAPSFKGLTTTIGIIKNQQMVADTLADYYEKHFQTPNFNPTNLTHIDASRTYKDFSRLPNIPLEKISLEEVEKNWKRAKQKKSTDTEGISAFLLHQLPTEYLQIVNIAFNKIAQSGIVLRKSKHAKVICLSKDGLYPAVDKLRPISLLSNFGKCFERIIHARILKWCNDKGIFTDEQSGFTSERRLQTRILSLIEDLRLTTAANNRPSLVIFVDFMSAFDKMWHPALLTTLLKLDIPLQLLRWIFLWLKGRTMSIHVGEAVSRVIKICVGTPQGSVLAATLFRLHVHFLPSYFMNLVCHLFADDLAIIISGALEKPFSKNIMELERQAVIAMKILEKFADDNLLPVNVQKTKALLVHDVVAPPYPKIKYKDVTIDFVKRFKYLGVEITTKLGWGIYISKRLKIIRKIYNALRILFYKIPLSFIHLRRKLFFAYALPHLIWLFPCWFFYTENQQKLIEHVYCTGLRITYNLQCWDDLTVYSLSREYTINDYLYKYWLKFNKHLENSAEAHQYQLTFVAYLASKAPQKSWYLSMGMPSGDTESKSSFTRFKMAVVQQAQQQQQQAVDVLIKYVKQQTVINEKLTNLMLRMEHHMVEQNSLMKQMINDNAEYRAISSKQNRPSSEK